MHERRANGDRELGRRAGHPAEGPGVEAAVEGLAPGQLGARGVARAPAHRRRRVQRRLRARPLGLS